MSVVSIAYITGFGAGFLSAAVTIGFTLAIRAAVGGHDR